jgi:N-acetylmuramoyl-L-alanine amidase
MSKKKVNGKEMSKGNYNNLAGVIIVAIITATTAIFYPFKNIDSLSNSNVHVAIVAGHNRIENNNYLTAGKQSPTWECGLKIYEGFSTQILALDLTSSLMQNNIDATIINNKSEMPLSDRVSRINDMYSKDKRLILIELHHNAQQTDKADYTDHEGQKGFLNSPAATGIEVFTSVGYTESDNIADNFIMPALKYYFPHVNFRNAGRSKEANYYMLRRTQCPAVLIEWLFMTTYSDCILIANPEQRKLLIQALTLAIVNYNYSLNKIAT